MHRSERYGEKLATPDITIADLIGDFRFTTKFGQGGSGLGLSVSHSIATSTLEGSLTVASQPGKGCCFTLRMAQQVKDL